MPVTYTVEPGDCLSSIALEYGFTWQSLWNDSANASGLWDNYPDSAFKLAYGVVELAVGIPEIAPASDEPLIRCGADPRRYPCSQHG